MILFVALGLTLAIAVAFRNQRPQWLRQMESQPERWLQCAWRGDNRRGVWHVLAFPWGFEDDDNDQEDRLHLGLDDGPFDRLDRGGEL
jgi:hypothetical protein